MECKCDFCKNKLPFQLPNEIIEETIKGNLVVFAGAGISTETRQIFKQTLYEEVAEEGLHHQTRRCGEWTQV